MNNRLNPDSEENQQMTKDNERAAFAAKMIAMEQTERDTGFWTIKAMRLYGGDFCKALAEACSRADDANLERIKDAFPELWEKYRAFGIMLKEKEYNES